MEFRSNGNANRRMIAVAVIGLIFSYATLVYMSHMGISVGSIIVSAIMVTLLIIAIIRKNMNKLKSMKIILSDIFFTLKMGDVEKIYYYNKIIDLELSNKLFGVKILRFYYERELQEIIDVDNVQLLHAELRNRSEIERQTDIELIKKPIEYVKFVTYFVIIATLLVFMSGNTKNFFHSIVYIVMIYSLSIRKQFSRSNWITRRKEVTFSYVLIAVYMVQFILNNI